MRHTTQALLQLRPSTVRMLPRDWLDNGAVDFQKHASTHPLQDVQPGALLVINPGDRIPCDGDVVMGLGAVDESSLTGESIPVAKAPPSDDTPEEEDGRDVKRSRLLQGTLCTMGSFVMRATTSGSQGALQVGTYVHKHGLGEGVDAGASASASAGASADMCGCVVSLQRPTSLPLPTCACGAPPTPGNS